MAIRRDKFYNLLAGLFITALLTTSFNTEAASSGAVAFTGNSIGNKARNFGTQGYTDSVEDLRVKVLGGHIRVIRTYRNNRWGTNVIKESNAKVLVNVTDDRVEQLN